MDDIVTIFSKKIDELFPLMMSQLETLCQQNSGSTHLEGLYIVQEMLINLFKPLSHNIEIIPMTPKRTLTKDGSFSEELLGNALWIRRRPKKHHRVLLVGHMDTVYHLDHSFQTLTRLSDNKLQGPGVADMKGGLLVILHALHLFELSPYHADLGWDVFINADEELSSPSSSTILAQKVNNHLAAFVFEPSLDEQGTFARQRKGCGKISILVKGKAAHVGRAFHEGKNAIIHLSKIILDIDKFSKQHPELVINVGTVSGGDALNIVPDWAICRLDVRMNTRKEEILIEQELNLILENHRIEGYDIIQHSFFGRPPKHIDQKTESLFNLMKTIGEAQNIPINWMDTGGCCDGNNLSELGIPVIDTLGVRGGFIHSPKEFILLDSLKERTLLTATLLHSLAQKVHEETII